MTSNLPHRNRQGRVLYDALVRLAAERPHITLHEAVSITWDVHPAAVTTHMERVRTDTAPRLFFVPRSRRFDPDYPF